MVKRSRIACVIGRIYNIHTRARELGGRIERKTFRDVVPQSFEQRQWQYAEREERG